MDKSASLSQAVLAKEAAAYLAGHIGETVTVTALALRFHVSESHLQNSFRAFFNSSVMAYSRRLRMQEAARMLRETERSVLDIAGLCGYDNPGKFSAAFRRFYGQTPLHYRKSHHVLLEHFQSVLE